MFYKLLFSHYAHLFLIPCISEKLSLERQLMLSLCITIFFFQILLTITLGYQSVLHHVVIMQPFDCLVNKKTAFLWFATEVPGPFFCHKKCMAGRQQGKNDIPRGDRWWGLNKKCYSVLKNLFYLFEFLINFW